MTFIHIVINPMLHGTFMSGPFCVEEEISSVYDVGLTVARVSEHLN